MIENLSHLIDPARCKTIVLKIGSSLLVDPDGQARRNWLRECVADIAAMRARKQRVVIVSSGAIALGAARMDVPRQSLTSLADAQAAASVGQIALASLWSDILEAAGLTAAQLLLTLGDMEDRRRYLNASSTIARLLDAGMVPVINENDSVATEEIRFGDNDRLATRVGQAAGAAAVVLLSDIDGLMDRDPIDPSAQMVPTVRGLDDTVRAMAGASSGSGLGTGGMVSKLQAAEIAERAGIALAIINGTHDRPLSRAIERNVGTVFVPTRNADARRSWLGGRTAPRGTLTIDAGCVTALNNGASVLAAGITKVVGTFERGDLVAVSGPDGAAVAQGLIEYDASACRAIMGTRQSQQEAILGYVPRSAIMHRDHLVML